MTWLYVPSASAQVSEDSTSASELPDPTRAVSLSWRGKHQQPQAWSRAWKRGGFIRLLSGLTSEPSSLKDGVERWIASCRAIPAKETALPESGSAPTTIDGCSTAQSTCSIKAGLRPSSAKTSRGTSPGNSPLPFRHWNDWAAGLRAEYSARPRPEPLTDASDSSSWPTAMASDDGQKVTSVSHQTMLCNVAEFWTTPVADDTGTRTKRYGQGGTALSMQAGQHWSTPKASDGEKGGPNMRGSKGDQPLPAQAAHWPTPMAGSAGTDTYNAAGNSDFSRRALEPAEEISLRLPQGPEIQDGQQSSETRRRLNPLFVEWLMGWPEGLSGFDTAAMASCRSLQPSPGCGCMDCWLTTQRAMLSDLLTIDPPRQGSLL